MQTINFLSAFKPQHHNCGFRHYVIRGSFYCRLRQKTGWRINVKIDTNKLPHFLAHRAKSSILLKDMKTFRNSSEYYDQVQESNKIEPTVTTNNS